MYWLKLKENITVEKMVEVSGKNLSEEKFGAWKCFLKIYHTNNVIIYFCYRKNPVRSFKMVTYLAISWKIFWKLHWMQKSKT